MFGIERTHSNHGDHHIHKAPTPELIYHNFDRTDDEWFLNKEYGDGKNLPKRMFVFLFEESESIHNLEAFDLPARIKKQGEMYSGNIYFDDKDLTHAESLMTLIDAEYKEVDLKDIEKLN